MRVTDLLKSKAIENFTKSAKKMIKQIKFQKNRKFKQ